MSSHADRMISSRHARVRWLGWMLRIRRYVAFDWRRGPWPKPRSESARCPLCGWLEE